MKAVSLVAAILAASLLAACGEAEVEEDPTATLAVETVSEADGPTESENSAPESQGSVTGSALDPTDPLADVSRQLPELDWPKAVQIAREETGTRRAVLARLQLVHSPSEGRWVYSVGLSAGEYDHEVTVDAESGTVVATERYLSDQDDVAVNPREPMTLEEAWIQAKLEVDGPVQEWTLGAMGDEVLWRFTIRHPETGAAVKVTVDIEDGRVTQVE